MGSVACSADADRRASIDRAIRGLASNVLLPMPELPEVECLKRTLEPLLFAARIESVSVRRRSFVESSGFTSSHEARAARTRPLLGATIERIERHGKELAIVEAGSGRALRVRLGMTGGLRIESASRRPSPLAHEHVRWTLVGSQGSFFLRHADPRRFGDLVVFPDHRALRSDRERRLGPDGLSHAPADLAEQLVPRLAATRRALKAALLDQSVIAGLGNIYADESLFRAGLAPSRPACSLTPAEALRLAEASVAVLEAAVRQGGSTLRDYRDAQGRSGSAQDDHQVYGRVGSPCPECGQIISGMVVAGRTTAFCGRCQQ